MDNFELACQLMLTHYKLNLDDVIIQPLLHKGETLRAIKFNKYLDFGNFTIITYEIDIKNKTIEDCYTQILLNLVRTKYLLCFGDIFNAYPEILQSNDKTMLRLVLKSGFTNIDIIVKQELYSTKADITQYIKYVAFDIKY